MIRPRDENKICYVSNAESSAFIQRLHSQPSRNLGCLNVAAFQARITLDLLSRWTSRDHAEVIKVSSLQVRANVLLDHHSRAVKRSQ